MKFSDIADRISSGDLNENEIDEFRRYCASWLFTLNEQYGQALAAAAIWLTENREKYKSYAEAERAWEALPLGQQQIKAKYHIKGIEALSDALQTTYWLRQREWKEAGKLDT